ncbi:hypothetical protein EGW08_020357 [Elysia chlorotica]|uniref:EB domain-containing protein n=1 Tax=Elysia chlorotica TaxID=188477 RepID=A0A3S0Z6R0_ELYCH|nr:hypothetical protein EGW08_020357 [Elysia chlorotica]
MENSLPIVLLVLSALAQSLVSSSSVCGSTGRACVAGRSSCVGGLCRCNGPDYVWGDPHFMCYTPKQVAAEVKNDPILTNFNGESSQFPFPCRYLLAHVSQNLQDGNNTVIGRCEVQVRF